MSSPFANKLSRFDVGARLGEGGMGVVYRAYDRELRQDVALKTLPSTEADGIYRLKREFRSLTELSHPNLVNLYELFSEHGSWFFTMELVDGVSFLAWVGGASGGDEAATRRKTDHASPTAGEDEATRRQVPTAASLTAGEEPTRKPTGRLGGIIATPERLGDEDATFVRTPTAETPAAGTSPIRPPASEVIPAIPAVRAPRRFDEARLREALRQLARGVFALHQAGKQHRDLKPANVMVAADGRVVLLDFGLAAAQKADELYAEQGDTAGTPAYMSPERFLGRTATEASDWYAVGVMLYEALAGTRPYSSARLYRGPEVPPPSPALLAQEVPEDLARLALELLRWSPEARPTGAQILERLGDRTPTGFAAISGISRAAFVGREAQLAALRGAFDDVRAGTPVLVQVTGTSGFGKTTLVRQFLGALHEGGEAIVLAGRCHERESMPFKVFDTVIDSLTRYLQTLTDFEAAKLLPRDVRTLAKLFPSLLRVKAVAASPRRELDVKDVQEVARLATAALKEFFGRIAARGTLVLFIDDLQWGDLDSARLLADVLRPPHLPQALLVVSYRSEELQGNEVLRQLLRATETAGDLLKVATVTIGPLSPDESKELARQVIGAGRAQEADSLIGEAAGSPLFVQQLAQYAAAGKALESDRRISLFDVIRARVAQLPANAAELLNAVSVAARPVPQQLVLETAGLTIGANEALNALRAGTLVRMGGPRVTDSIEVYHDKIRETVVADLPKDRLRALHERMATLLEQALPVDAEALVHHWQAAGDLPRAAGFAMQAAARAAEALAFDRAAELYGIALAGLAPDHADVRRAQVARAEALRNAGRAPEAAAAYLEAAAGSTDPAESTELERLAFEQFLVSGYLEKGREVARRVLASVGLGMPATGRAALVSLLWQRLKISLRGLGIEERPESEIPGDLLRRIDTCWSMATGLSMFDTLLGADFNARYVLLALKGGEVGRISRALAFEAAHVTTSGGYAKAERLLQVAAPLADRADDHARGFVAQNRGFLEYFKGHYRESLAAFDRASEIFRSRCSGVNWEVSTSQMFSNWSLVYLGDWQELARRGPQLMLEARRSGNLYRVDGLTMSYRVSAGLLEDQVERTREEMTEAARQWTPAGFQIQQFLRLYMTGLVDLYAGDGRAAYDRLVSQQSALRSSLLLQVEDVRYRIATLRGYSAVAAGGTGEHRDAARAASKVLRKINSVGAKGVADVVAAALARREGKLEQAAALLAKAAADFDRAEMALFAAASRWRHGELVGGEAGRAAVEDTRNGLISRGFAAPERVVRLFAPGFDG